MSSLSPKRGLRSKLPLTKSAPLSLGLALKSDSPQSLHCFRRILPFLTQVSNPKLPSPCRIFIEKSCQKSVGSLPKGFSFVPSQTLGEKCDLLLTLGGDGTLLRGARLLLDSNGWKRAKILGINAGNLGFMTFVPAEDSLQILKKLLPRFSACAVEERSCLEVGILRKGKSAEVFHVLNDCVLTKGSLSRLFEFKVETAEDFLSSYRADGLIVSTPTGSTAYNLAAGGAILEPQIPAIQLTPICAQSFSNKPIVVSDRHEILLSLGRHSIDVHLTLDGHTGVKIESSDRIRIRKSPKHLSFLLPPGRTPAHYMRSLRQKLKWGLLP